MQDRDRTLGKTPIIAAIVVISAIALFAWLLFFRSTDNGVAAAPPPPQVPILSVEAQELPRVKQFEGFIEAGEEVFLRARTSGQIAEVLVREGAQVERGDPLFRLDVSLQRARADELAAQIERTRVALVDAERDAERAARLLPSGAISVREAEDAQSEVALLLADLAAGQASERAARLELSYGTVRAPISARANEVLVDRGSLVRAGEGGTPLVRLVATDRLEVVIDMPEEDYLALSMRGSRPTATIALATNPELEIAAPIDFSAPEIDLASGTVRVKARIERAPPAFLPGAFVRVAVPLEEPRPTILVPEIAIGNDQDLRFVLVIDEENIAQFRPVRLGGRIGEQRIVEEGLAAGERVLVKGLIRPGMTVAPVAWNPGADAAP